MRTKQKTHYYYLRIILSRNISRFLIFSSCLGIREARHLRDLIIPERASFLTSFLVSLFSSSSLKLSKNLGTLSYKATYKMVIFILIRSSICGTMTCIATLGYNSTTSHFLFIQSSIIQFYSLICTKINAKWEQTSKFLYKLIQ